MSDLNWNIRKHYREFCESKRLEIFINLYLHRNIRNRAWPTYDTVIHETGTAKQTIRDAYVWMTDHLMIVKVPYAKRIGDEKTKATPRQTVWQLTGVMLFGEELEPYIHLTHEGWEGMLHELEDIFEILPTRISKFYSEEILPSRTKGISIKDSQGNKGKGIALPFETERSDRKFQVIQGIQPTQYIPIIKAWLAGLPGSAPHNPYSRTVCVMAVELLRFGATSDDVTRYMQKCYSESFWTGKTMKFRHLRDNLPAWKAKNPNPRRMATQPSPAALPPKPEDMASPEEIAAEMKQYGGKSVAHGQQENTDETHGVL